MKNIQTRIHPKSVILGAAPFGVALFVSSVLVTRSPHPLLTRDQMEFLNSISMTDLNDGQGGRARTVRITGLNLQIVNGLGATNGFPFDPDSVDPLDTVVNSVGNLIVGYNELGHPFGDDRTGSHNIVVGHGNNYSSFGGLISGSDNTISGAYASVSAGNHNRATGDHSSVSGGHNNTASGVSSAVSGGGVNEASGKHASVSGGVDNVAFGEHASVTGGNGNGANGLSSSVSGGLGRSAGGDDDWVAGSLFEDD